MLEWDFDLETELRLWIESLYEVLQIAEDLMEEGEQLLLKVAYEQRKELLS